MADSGPPHGLPALPTSLPSPVPQLLGLLQGPTPMFSCHSDTWGLPPEAPGAPESWTKAGPRPSCPATCHAPLSLSCLL